MTKITIFRDTDEYIEFVPGATIFHQGDAPTAMYVVIEGEVELRLNGKTMRVIGPDEIFGEMALVDNSPRSASAIAKTVVKLAEVNQRRFLLLVEKMPQFSLDVMSVLAERLRDMSHTHEDDQDHYH